MRKFLVILTSAILTSLLFSSTVYAKSVIKRIDPEMATSSSVAMALDTYDGSFFDVDEFKKIMKAKGNVKTILDSGAVTLKTGEQIDANAIRFFFVQTEQRRIGYRKSDEIGKKPSEDE